MQIFNAVTTAISLLSVTMFFLFLFEPKYKLKTTVIASCICYGTMIGVYIFLSIIVDIEVATKLMPFVLTFPSIIFCFVISKYKNGRFFFTFCTADITGLVIAISCSVFNQKVIKNPIGSNIFTIFCFVIATIFIYKYISKPFRNSLSVSKNGWWLIAFVSMLFYLELYLILLYPVPILKRPNDMILAFVFILIIILVYVIFLRTIKQFLFAKDLEAKEQNFNSLINFHKSQFEMQEAKIKLSKIYKHDAHHHYNIILKYLDNNDVENARLYLNKIIDFNSSVQFDNYCKNMSVNTVLSIYVEKFKKELIDYDFDVIIPKEIDINEIELGALFSNLLENSFNAVRNASNKKVSIYSRYNNERLVLECKNTFEAEVEFDKQHMPKTNRQDGGTGTKSVRYIVERHNGILNFTTDQKNNIFIARIVINLS